MKTYTDRITLVFPIADKSRAGAASLQTLTVLDNGREIEDLIPLDPDKVADYASEFNLPLIAEIDAAQKAMTDAESSHAETVAMMQAEIDRLTSLIPPTPGPRQITRREFSARFDAMAPGKMRAIWDSDSDIAFQVCLALFTWDGPIDLDSPLLAQLLGGLVQTGFLTSDEMTAIIGAR